jgi:hypothetical protein
MDHAAAQRTDPLQQERHVGHREIRQRCRISGPAAARVDPDRGPLTAGLTPGALPLDALLEAVVEQPFPKTARPLGVIHRELDQRQPRARHAPKATAPSSRVSDVHTRHGRTRAAPPNGPGMAVLVIPMPGGVRPPTDDTAAMIARLARHGAPRTGEVLARTHAGSEEQRKRRWRRLLLSAMQASARERLSLPQWTTWDCPRRVGPSARFACAEQERRPRRRGAPSCSS